MKNYFFIYCGASCIFSHVFLALHALFEWGLFPTTTANAYWNDYNCPPLSHINVNYCSMCGVYVYRAVWHGGYKKLLLEQILSVTTPSHTHEKRLSALSSLECEYVWGYTIGNTWKINSIWASHTGREQKKTDRYKKGWKRKYVARGLVLYG